MYERCVPSSCSHDDQGCHPVTCDAPTACNIVDCTEALSNSTTCFTGEPLFPAHHGAVLSYC